MANKNTIAKNKKISNSKLPYIRMMMKTFSIFSVVVGGLMPIIYWNILITDSEDVFTQYESIIFFYLIIASIVNVTYGVLTYWWSTTKQDFWITQSKSIWFFNMPILILGGSFILGVLYFYLWRYSKKRYDSNY